MAHLLIVVLLLIALSSGHRLPHGLVGSVSLLLLLCVTACISTVSPSRLIPEERVRHVCWQPPELDAEAKYFVFPGASGVAVAEGEPGFGQGLAEGGFVYAYDEHAPVRICGYSSGGGALGPLGGAKFLASGVSKGTRALQKAVARLGELPIFTPGAAGADHSSHFYP